MALHRVLRWVGWAMVVVGAAVPRARAEFETPTALTNLTIVTSPGVTIDSGTIVMFKGRIIAVGSDVSVPPDAETIDCTGLIAYPGFIDAHSHLGIAKDERTEAARHRTEDVNPDVRTQPLPATRAANRRGIRPQVRAAEQYVLDDTLWKQHRAAGFAAALVAPRGGILGGTSDLISLSGAPVRRSILREGVGMHASFRTGEPGKYPGSLLGVFAQFRQALLDAGWYVKMRKYYERHPFDIEPPAHDDALDALQPMLRRAEPIIFDASSENEIRRALSLCAEFRLDPIISGAREAYKVIDVVQAGSVPLIVSIKFDEEPEYGKKKKDKQPDKGAKQQPDAPDKPEGGQPEGGRAEGGKAEGDQPSAPTGAKGKKTGDKDKKIYEPLKVRKERRRLWEEKVANVIRLHEAGVPFSLSTRGFEKPKELFKNLRKLFERGLPEGAAVAALTSVPAKLLGMERQLGAISPGYLANVTVMTARLSDEKAKVKYAFVAGKKFEMDDDKDDKASDKKKPDEPEDTPSRNTEASDSPSETVAGAAGGDASAGGSDKTSASDEHGEDQHDDTMHVFVDEPDDGPTFATEIKADRVPATRTGGNVLIRNATVIPVTAPTLHDASILIRDGRIEAVGADIAAPEGVTVIDATGRFVIPGFVDAHSHLGTDGVNESALAITAEVRIADTINPKSTGIYRAVAGGTTTHHVMHGSANPIGGQNAILKLKYGRGAEEMLMRDAPPTIKFALGENVIQSNWSSAWGKRYPNTRMGVEAVIRMAFERAKAYREVWDAYKRDTASGKDVPPPRRDLRLEALTDILAGRLTVHSHCYRSDEILRLMAVAEDYGFRIGTLQHVLEGYRIAPEIARHGAGASTFSNFWAYKIEAYGAIPYNAALMTEHGIVSSVNSDSANTIRYFGLEAAKCIKWGGVDERAALRLVTINPAMQLQIDDRVGSIEVGKDGDVAIFNGHPLNAFSKCIMTLIEGEVYFEDARPEPVEDASTLTLPGPVDRSIPQTVHRAYAVTGATVHPISGPPIPGATVVIVDDKIHAVGREVVVPPGAGIIDATGMHVYPGLIDAGTSLGLTEIGSLRATRDNRENGSLNPHLRARSAVHPHSKHLRIARTVGITTAVTKPAGGNIAGQSAVIHLDGWTADEMLVMDTFGLHMSVPSLPVHLPTDKEAKKRRKKQHKEETKALEDFLDKAKHYAKVKALAERDPDITYDVDLVLEAMIPYVRGDKPVVFAASGYKQMLDTIAFAEKHELRCIISGGTGAWKLADVLADKHIPVILGTVLSYPWGEFEPWDAIYRCAGVLDEAGVKFCFASESASGAYNLPFHAGMAVAHGLPAARAEYALTLGAAEILGIDDRVGTLEVGKEADLIVTTGTPLQTVSQVTHMFIAGRPVELTSMHTESYEKYKNRPEPILPPPPDLVGPPSLTGR
ncbi:MAG: amidohydrolase family protein [Phycisphaerae bacterium]